MTVDRRMFVSGMAASGGLALSGFLGELRVWGAEGKPTRSKTARILFNENPLGPSPLALKALAKSPEMFARYPLGEAPALEAKLRKLNGLPYPEAQAGLSLSPAASIDSSTDLLLGVGSSEILKAIAWAYCSQGGNVVEAHPGYSAVGSEANGIPGAIVERKMIPLDANNRIDVDAMIAAIDADTRVVVVCNPNNPTGTTLSLTEIERIAAATPPSALLLVDEAYIEFLSNAAEVSAIELAKATPNVLVARTFSKIYGLAGLRVGYGLAAREVIARLKPYMLGRLSLSMAGVMAADAALDDTQHIADTIDLNRKIQSTWNKEFAKLGWHMAPSDACFAWVDLGCDCGDLVKYLASREVLISGGQRWSLPNCVRISIGTEEENDRLLAGIREFKKA